jgi:hypothetical protein
MKTVELLRVNLSVAHDLFSKTVADVTQEMADWATPGLAHPIGERWAHLVQSEDWLVNGMARGVTPLFASDWAEKKGYGELNVSANPDEARAFRVDVQALREYMQAVFTASEHYFGSLGDADMERMIDMSFVNYGMVPFPAWASTFIIGHVRDLMGEISVVKGLQGAKGYPF